MMTFLARRFALAVVPLGLMIGTAGRARADFILNSGTPDQRSNLSISGDPNGQFVAQQFTLTSSVFISTIEVYYSGNSFSSAKMDLATAIGSTATAANLLGSFTLPQVNISTPNVGAWDPVTLNRQMAAGTYYLVFSPSGLSGTFSGGDLPTAAPTPFGPTFNTGSTTAIQGLAISAGFNTSFPLPSSFAIGVRISGPLVSVPEPSSLTLCGLAGLAGLGYSWRRRERAA